MDAWENFFEAQVGAAATLGGLLFVGISLNLSRILSAGAIANRALVALVLLLIVLLISSAMLVPGQSSTALAIEILVGAGTLTGLRFGLSRSEASASAAMQRHRDPSRNAELGPEPGSFVKTFHKVLFSLAVIPMFTASAFLLANRIEVALYLLAVAICFSYVKAVLDSWVLLVEIDR